MPRHRVRIRFAKRGDLRWISHRDLVRTFERLFRRAELELSMSEGFHPKPRMSFPSALALGIEGLDEVMEVELSVEADPEELRTRLSQLAPPGLDIRQVLSLAPKQGKPQVQRTAYEISVPEAYHDQAQVAVVELLASETHPLERSGRNQPIDVRAGIEELEFTAGTLRMVLAQTRQASVRPREVLQALGLDGLEQEGQSLKRTAVLFHGCAGGPTENTN